jgi:2-dehydro-3-deoxyphosphooctonate aldolase (KDO 8-P synthase)
VHPDPDNAPSDGANMLRLDDFEEVVASIDAISKVAKENKNVKMY